MSDKWNAPKDIFWELWDPNVFDARVSEGS